MVRELAAQIKGKGEGADPRMLAIKQIDKTPFYKNEFGDYEMESDYGGATILNSTDYFGNQVWEVQEYHGPYITIMPSDKVGENMDIQNVHREFSKLKDAKEWAKQEIIKRYYYIKA